jgi:hypothetical protein
MCDFLDCEKWKELNCSQYNADIFKKPTCYRPLTSKTAPVATLRHERLVKLRLSDEEIKTLETHLNMVTTTMDDRDPDYLMLGEIYNKFLKAIGSEKAT